MIAIVKKSLAFQILPTTLFAIKSILNSSHIFETHPFLYDVNSLLSKFLIALISHSDDKHHYFETLPYNLNRSNHYQTLDDNRILLFTFFLLTHSELTHGTSCIVFKDCAMSLILRPLCVAISSYGSILHGSNFVLKKVDLWGASWIISLFSFTKDEMFKTHLRCIFHHKVRSLEFVSRP